MVNSQHSALLVCIEQEDVCDLHSGDADWGLALQELLLKLVEDNYPLCANPDAQGVRPEHFALVSCFLPKLRR